MLQKNRKYFLAGVFLLTPFLLFSAPVPAPVSKYYPVHFEDAAYSSRAKTIVFVNMLRNEVRSYLPAKARNGLSPRKITVLYEKGPPEKVFSLRKNPRGICIVTLPENFEQMLALPGVLPLLTAWFLTAAAGMDPAIMAPRITNSWYVTGIARKLLRNISPVKSPFTQYFPSAYVLTAHDRYPELDALLRQELTAEDSTIRLLYEEYAEILVLICQRHHLFRKGLLISLLEEFRKNPDRNDMAELFRQYATELLSSGEKKLFKIREGEEKNTVELFETWFRQEIEKILNWNFLPASAVKIERLYRNALRFEAARKKKKGSKTTIASGKNTRKPAKDLIRGNLIDLLEKYSELENPALPAASMAFALGKISRFAPPDLILDLLAVRSALHAFAADPGTQTVHTVRNAHKKFYAALERNALLEQFLTETEKKMIPPGTRYYVTNIVLRNKYEKQLSIIRHFDELLRKTQRKILSP